MVQYRFCRSAISLVCTPCIGTLCFSLVTVHEGCSVSSSQKLHAAQCISWKSHYFAVESLSTTINKFKHSIVVALSTQWTHQLFQ